MVLDNNVHAASVSIQPDVRGGIRFGERFARVEFGIEHIAWSLLIILALGLRVWKLDVRSMSHDESLHAYFSWLLFTRGTYTHDPMMHGPFLFYLNAFIYSLFGVSDATARFGPALAGTGLVAFVFVLRKELGRLGALCAAIFVTISPSLLFYSRYIRNDMYIALFSLVWIVAYYRYSQRGNDVWLWVMTMAMALAFVTKENAFLFGAIIGAHALFETIYALWKGHGRDRHAELAILMLTFVLPFLSPLVLKLLGVDPLTLLHGQHAVLGGGVVIGFVLVGACVAAGGAFVRWVRFPLWCGLFALFWSVQIFFFSSFLSNLPTGLFSGIVGSVGYWLAQQGVARGSQPWFYYGFLTMLYEFFPCMAAGLGVLSFWGQRRDRQSRSNFSDDGSLYGEQTFGWLLVWWVAGSYVLYTVAGEKMPWLLVHMALPMCLLAGLGIGWVLSLRHQQLWRALAVCTSVILVSVWIRFSYLANVTHLNGVSEPLVYAHGTSGIKQALGMIHLVQQECPTGSVAFDEETAWPLTWYRHNIEGSFYFGKTPDDRALSSCVLVVGEDSVDKVVEQLGENYKEYRYRMIGWPAEFYKQWTGHGVFKIFYDSQYRQDLLNWYWHRDSDAPDGYQPIIRYLSLLVRQEPFRGSRS